MHGRNTHDHRLLQILAQDVDSRMMEFGKLLMIHSYLPLDSWVFIFFGDFRCYDGTLCCWINDTSMAYKIYIQIQQYFVVS